MSQLKVEIDILQLGIDIDIIVQSTGLSKSQIDSLIENIKDE